MQVQLQALFLHRDHDKISDIWKVLDFVQKQKHIIGLGEQSERVRPAIAQARGAVCSGPAVAVTLQSSPRERVSLQWLCMTLLGEVHPKHCAYVLT